MVSTSWGFLYLRKGGKEKLSVEGAHAQERYAKTGDRMDLSTQASALFDCRSAPSFFLSSSGQDGDLALDAESENVRIHGCVSVCILEDGRNAVGGSQSSTLSWISP